jgi:hypothetical protein
MHATFSDKPEVVKLLIASGADIHALDQVSEKMGAVNRCLSFWPRCLLLVSLLCLNIECLVVSLFPLCGIGWEHCAHDRL